MEAKKTRLIYIDNIRLLMIVFVVVQHLAVTYSGMGSWYYREGKPIGFLAQLLFGFYQTLTQGYFMGLLFLIAGYFVPRAYDRKGFGRFVTDRLIRLGIPTLLYMLIIHPFTDYVLMSSRDGFHTFTAYYWHYLISLDFIGSSGPLWFAFALLVFTVLYAAVRLIFGGKEAASARQITIGWKSLTALILGIAALAFLIRTVQPMGTSVLNMQLCYFAQYIVLFILGTAAYRHDLFSKLNYRMGKRLLIGALTLGFAAWCVIMQFGGARSGNMTAINGGFTWQSAAFSLWETFTAVAVDFALIVLFRERFNKQGKFTKALSASAFAVYVFHTPIIVAITVLFKSVQWLPGLKFFTMVAVCLPICFAVAHYVIMRIPGLKKVM